MDNYPSRAGKQKKGAMPKIPKPAIYVGIAVVLAIVAIAITVNLNQKDEMADVPDGDMHAYEQLSKKQIQQAIDNVDVQVSEQRQTIIDSGMTLLGKVHYFWGGKSLEIGWDDSWGQLELLTEEGSAKTGQEIPYGLDCSGFVSWCVRQTGMTEAEVKNKLGQGTYHQWENSEEITWDEIIPGDLAFQNIPGGNRDNHVGICIGYADDGAPIFLHCAATFDNVVVTGRGDIFNYPRRPKIYAEQDNF